MNDKRTSGQLSTSLFLLKEKAKKQKIPNNGVSVDSIHHKGLYTYYYSNNLMSNEKSTNNNNEKGAIIALKFDQMTEEQQKARLQKIIDDKTKTLDANILVSKLGVNLVPSDEIQKMGYEVRHSLAEGLMTMVEAKAKMREMYNKCVEMGYEASQARKVVGYLITRSDGVMLVDERTLRRMFPESTDKSKITEATKQAQIEKEAKAKTPEAKEGLIEVYLPPAAAQAIAKFGNAGEPCLLFLSKTKSGFVYSKVKAAKIVETVEKKAGQQVTKKVETHTK